MVFAVLGRLTEKGSQKTTRDHARTGETKNRREIGVGSHFVDVLQWRGSCDRLNHGVETIFGPSVDAERQSTSYCE